MTAKESRHAEAATNVAASDTAARNPVRMSMFSVTTEGENSLYAVYNNCAGVESPEHPLSTLIVFPTILLPVHHNAGCHQNERQSHCRSDVFPRPGYVDPDLAIISPVVAE